LEIQYLKEVIKVLLNTPDEIAAHLAEQGRLNGVSLE
jgi:hypothetical protein